MLRSSLRFPCGLLLLLSSLSACGDPNRSANQEFVRLSEAISVAAQTKDPLERATRLNSAVQGVDDFMRDYPSSNAAVRIAANEKIGPLNKDELRLASEEASFDSVVCRKNITERCLLGNAIIRFMKYNDYAKKALALSYMVDAIRSENREAKQKFEYYAASSWTPPSSSNTKFGFAKIAGIYLADQLTRNPSKFWEQASALAGGLPDPTFIQAYEIALESRFSQKSDFLFVDNASKAIEFAPDQFRAQLRKILLRKRSILVEKMNAQDVVENIGKIQPQEVIRNYFIDGNSLTPSNQNKLLNFIPPTKLGDVIIYLNRVDEPTMRSNLKRSMVNLSQGKVFLREYMMRFPHAKNLEQFLLDAEFVGNPGKCQVLFNRYIIDLKVRRNDAAALAHAYDCNKTISNLLAMIAKDGFGRGAVNAIRGALARKEIGVDTAPLLALSSVAGTEFPTRRVIELDFDWIDDPATFHASASLFLSSLARHLDKNSEYAFSDDDASFFVDHLIKSKFLPEYAYYVGILEDRGLVDISKKLAGSVKKSQMSDVENEELNTPIIKKIILEGKIDDAVVLFFSLPLEVRARMLGRLSVENNSSENFDKFFLAVGSRDPSLIGQMVYRAMLNHPPSDEARNSIIIKYGNFLGQYKNIDLGYVIDPYINAIWRSKDIGALSRVYFDQTHPLIDAAALYVLVDRLMTAGRR